MKTYLHAFAMCQSMFCAIPCPWKIWDEKAQSKMLLFLPVIGLEIGALWWLLSRVCRLLCLAAPVYGVLLCAFPYIITGFIHLDGYMDVTDAIGSWRTLERRREILKDSHVGSFAVIGVCLLLLAQFAFFTSRAEENPILFLIPAVSRCCSALAVTALKPMNTSQYAGKQLPLLHVIPLSFLMLLLIAAGFLFCEKNGFALVGCLIGYALALWKAYRTLEGMNGDISGYALTIGELCAVGVSVLI